MSPSIDPHPAPPRRTGPAAVDAPDASLRRRPSTWIAVGLFALAVGMIVFLAASSLVLPGADRLPSRPEGIVDVLWIAITLGAFVSLPTMGAILAILRPRSPIGWLLLGSGVAIILGTSGPEYVDRSLVLGAELPGDRVVDWLAARSEGLGFMIVAVWIPLLFPDGRLPGPRWRPVAWAAALAMATSVVAGALTVHGDGEWDPEFPNPLAAEGWLADLAVILVDVGNLVLLACIPLAAASVIVRFRRSRGAEREQMKWFLAAAAILAGAFLLMAGVQQDWTYILTLACFSLLPVAIGIAVLRYRLYEIDRLISRTIGWAIVTGVLVGTFALLILGLQAVVEPLTGGNTLAIAGSTLVVAALFNPVRTRVQRAVDRRFDRSRYDGERLLAAFGERLRDEVDLTTISADVLATVDAAVRP
ncbi:MAG TPA: hypothetical protein VLA23_09975, partial [Candidatus Limnocylindrales bacterium]|nr:hypothetical protein [Candidatus Limnocylindrales bacterium]